MNAELQGYGDQLLSVKQDAAGLMSGLTDAQFNWPPGPGRWSMAGCFDHLNKSAAGVFMPMIDGALADARARDLRSVGPFAYPFLERWFVKNSDAPPRRKFKAQKAFLPAAHLSVDQVRTEFFHWQDELQKRMREADGYDLQRAKRTFPFWPLKWSLGGIFLMMLAHERRHIWQARQVRQHPGFPAA